MYTNCVKQRKAKYLIQFLNQMIDTDYEICNGFCSCPAQN